MHWAERYVGIPYEEMDCAALCVHVQHEVFSRHVALPSEREATVHGVSYQITMLKESFAVPTYSPVEGDAVLMIGRGRINHIGLFAMINGIPHCLHAMRNAGHACLHRIRDLSSQGLQVEGYYQWK